MKVRTRTGLLVVAVVLTAIIGYKYRGLIRKQMMRFLHSFDDVPADSTDVMPPGRWWPARDGAVPDSSSQQDLINSLGYLSGYEEAPLWSSVTVYDSLRVSEGYTVLISGHAPGINMIDIKGDVVHEWYSDEVSVYGLWPDAQDREVDFDLWRRAWLYENGDLLALINAGGVVKLDYQSNLLWASEFIGAHHDLDVGEDGNIYVIGRDVSVNENYNPDAYIAEDYLVVLDSLGNTVRKVSMLDLIADSPWAPTLQRAADGTGQRLNMTGDILHCNTIEYIRSDMLPHDYKGPLRAGTILLSMRATDLVCAVDLEEMSVYWAESNLWHMQHQPTILPDGSMLVFDNRGMGDASTVLQFDPDTREVTWLYRGDRENPFYSLGVGSCQRLPDGNTLITESMFGRAFEVTLDGEIVWEYYNPHRAGDGNQLIATLHEAFRVSPDYTRSWLQVEVSGDEEAAQ